MVTRGLGPGGELSVDLVTSDIIIDREHPEILSEGGLYQFQVSSNFNLFTSFSLLPYVGGYFFQPIRLLDLKDLVLLAITHKTQRCD